MAPSHVRSKVIDPSMRGGTPACRGERVTYSLAGTTLTRQEVGVDAAPSPIATGISALTFTYPTEEGTYDSTVATTTQSRFGAVRS